MTATIRAQSSSPGSSRRRHGTSTLATPLSRTRSAIASSTAATNSTSRAPLDERKCQQGLRNHPSVASLRPFRPTGDRDAPKPAIVIPRRAIAMSEIPSRRTYAFLKWARRVRSFIGRVLPYGATSGRHEAIGVRPTSPTHVGNPPELHMEQRVPTEHGPTLRLPD